MHVTVSRPFNKTSLKVQTLEKNQFTTVALEQDHDALPLANVRMSAHDPQAGAARSSKGGD
jgi:hypothetical protein